MLTFCQLIMIRQNGDGMNEFVLKKIFLFLFFFYRYHVFQEITNNICMFQTRDECRGERVRIIRI